MRQLRVPLLVFFLAAAFGVAAFSAPRTAVAQPLSETTVFGITNNNTIVRFVSSAPSVVTKELAITGLKGGEQAVSIDQRPCPCDTFILTNLGNIYQVNTESGATKIYEEGLLPSYSPPANIEVGPPGTALNLIATIGTQDFSIQPFVNIATQTPSVSSRPLPAYSPTDPNRGTNPPIVTALAFSRNYTSAPQSRLYGIDSANSKLVLVDTATGILTPVANLNLPIAEVNGFDIVTKLDQASQTSDDYGFFLVKLQGSAAQSLYSLKLASGDISFLGQFGGPTPLRDIALGLAGDFILGTDQLIVPESFGVVNIPIKRVRLGRPNTLDTEVIVRVSTPVNPAPSLGEDFRLERDLFTRRIRFAPGEYEKSYPIEIVNDSIGESNETLLVQIEMPSDTGANGASVGEPSKTRIVIVDDDAGATGGFSSNIATLSLRRNRVSLRKLLRGKRLQFAVKANCTENCKVAVKAEASGYELGRISNKKRDRLIVFGKGADKKSLANFAGDRSVRITLANRYRSTLVRLKKLAVTLRITAVDDKGESYVGALPIIIR